MNEEVARRIIRAFSMLLNRSLVVVLCLPLAMGCYALWDSHVVYERANVSQWQPYKPTEPEPLSFWELQRINPEVRAWLSVYGTNIDYPVCQAAQGSENKYVTTNAKGEYSLSGALFMDTANAADFSDFATIVYGHHMENKVMFGAISDFSQREFFDEHRYGNLFANDTDYGLEFFCLLDADAYDRSIYCHTFAGDGEREGYLKLLHERARNWRTGVEIGKDDPALHLLVRIHERAGDPGGQDLQRAVQEPVREDSQLGYGRGHTGRMAGCSILVLVGIGCPGGFLRDYR